MRPKLISFVLCPFVQKATIILALKNIEHDVEYIDLENPPEWFLKISPFGKVPLLQLGDEVLFESNVICEYLDEAYGEPLHPSDLIAKAKNRSWMEFSGPMLFDGYYLACAKDQENFDKYNQQLSASFDRLEGVLNEGPYFNGDSYSLVDVSYAPMFQRLQFIESITSGIFTPTKHPKVNAWKEALLSHPTLPKSAIANLEELYLQFVKKENGYLAGMIS